MWQSWTPVIHLDIIMERISSGSSNSVLKTSLKILTSYQFYIYAQLKTYSYCLKLNNYVCVFLFMYAHLFRMLCIECMQIKLQWRTIIVIFLIHCFDTQSRLTGFYYLFKFLVIFIEPTFQLIISVYNWPFYLNVSYTNNGQKTLYDRTIAYFERGLFPLLTCPS